MSTLDSVRRRLAALERQRPQSTDYEVLITGGMPGSAAPTQATSGSRVWHREDGEGYEAFRRRVWAEARSAGVYAVAFGGMPSK